MTEGALRLREELAAAAALKPAEYHRVARAVRALPDSEALAPIRVALLGSFSLQFVEPFLVVEGFRRGFRVETYFGAFGQLELELGGASLWAFKPDVVVLLMRPEDVEPEAVLRYQATAGRRFAELADALLERLAAGVRAVRQRGSAPVVIANFAAPAHLPLGSFDAAAGGSLTHALAASNRALAERLSGVAGAVVWDYAGLVRGRGSDRWTDPRLWAMARAAVAAEHQPALAAHLVRTIAALRRAPAKVLVLDLDNTLWGGVIGDDGLAGIQLGDDYPGSVYKAFQHAVLGLRDRGVLLAICSKNDHAIVEETFRTHPEMVIGWDDLSCTRINWRPKSENLREIAAELNLGIDALVLFDDNPVERAEVRLAVPEVGVIEVPPDPLRYAEALYACEWFDQPALSAEDQARAVMYREERQRQDLAGRAGTAEEFLRELDMTAEVGRVDQHTLGRVAQLVGKTNQFNLTTRRHSQSDIAAMAAREDRIVAWLRLRDRFGDQGLVAVGIVNLEGATAHADTFLMSCRVMNRKVEQAFMAYLVEQARALGCTTFSGEYLPTRKNGVVSGLYADLGFSRRGDAPDGGTVYALDLKSGDVSWPDVIRRG